MSFLAPLVGALPAIGGMLGGLFGGGRPGQSGAEKQVSANQVGISNAQLQALQSLLGYTGQLQPFANGLLNNAMGNTAAQTSLLNEAVDRSGMSSDQLAKAFGQAGGQASGYNQMANSSFTPAINYWTSMLAGGPQAMQAASPGVQAINNAYTQQQRQAAQFAPMGGGRAQTMNNLPLQAAGQIGNLIAQQSPMAAQQLGQLGSQTGGLGANLLGQIFGAGTGLAGQSAGLGGGLASGLMGLGGQLSGQIGSNYGNAASGAGANNMGFLGYGLQQQQLGAQNGGLLGSGISNILKNINFGGFGGNTSVPQTGIGGAGYGIGSWSPGMP